MGYTTNFNGQFDLDKPLTAAHKEYLDAFNRSRRMKRDASKTIEYADPLRLAVGLPIGNQGEYYVGASETDFGQVHSADILDYNNAPADQPGLWCQWVPSDDGTAIVWDDGEKFYDYTEWIEYLIENFLAPWGYSLNGEVKWSGEDDEDKGTIHVKNNRVQAISVEIVHPKPKW